jgi:CheY-like chemotaxis protein
MFSSQAKHQAKRILIVDDIEDNLFLLETILTEEGYKVDSATNGQISISQDRSFTTRFSVDGCHDARNGWL